jgi:transcriptional activator SPT8
LLIKLSLPTQQWDLNTGQRVRNFTAHGAQLAGIAVRPDHTVYSDTGPAVIHRPTGLAQEPKQENPPSLPLENASAVDTPMSMELTSGQNIKAESRPRLDSDTKSDASFDPLFDDEPDGSNADDVVSPVMPTPAHAQSQPATQHRATLGLIPPPKNAPPLLDPATYATYSPNLLMTTAIDGQIILWDKRTHSLGKGVGRLWMSEKTPPWCLSVWILNIIQGDKLMNRLLGLLVC